MQRLTRLAGGQDQSVPEVSTRREFDGHYQQQTTESIHYTKWYNSLHYQVLYIVNNIVAVRSWCARRIVAKLRAQAATESVAIETMMESIAMSGQWDKQCELYKIDVMISECQLHLVETVMRQVSSCISKVVYWLELCRLQQAELNVMGFFKNLTKKIINYILMKTILLHYFVLR